MRAIPRLVGAVVVAGWIAVGGCLVHDPLYCHLPDHPCTDPARPVCDVNGQFDESDHIANTCISTPANCPVEICGCTAGAFLSCDGDNALRCGSDGMSSTSEACAIGCDSTLGGCTCAAGVAVCAAGALEVCEPSGVFGAPTSCPLGCAADGKHCLDVSASNGLNAALDTPGQRSDFTLDAGVTFDTNTGVVLDGTGSSIAIPSVLVTQASAPAIRAFLVRSVTLSDATVKGTNAFAIVADETIELRGRLDVRGHGGIDGAGASTAVGCAGADGTVFDAGTLNQGSSGPGGGGHATAGARGGNNNGFAGGIGGATVNDPDASPLVGGCGGGIIPAVSGIGGGGGGAAQLVARVEIRVVVAGQAAGQLNIGGGGAPHNGGGGSGGTALLEAPSVVVAGAGAGVFANGGGGSECDPGQDGVFGPTAAVGGNCATSPQGPHDYWQGGAGGTGTGAPLAGADYCPPPPSVGFCTLGGNGPGGGGAVGRLRVNDATGTFAATSGASVSAQSSVGTIGTR